MCFMGRWPRRGRPRTPLSPSVGQAEEALLPRWCGRRARSQYCCELPAPHPRRRSDAPAAAQSFVLLTVLLVVLGFQGHGPNVLVSDITQGSAGGGIDEKEPPSSRLLSGNLRGCFARDLRMPSRRSLLFRPEAELRSCQHVFSGEAQDGYPRSVHWLDEVGQLHSENLAQRRSVLGTMAPRHLPHVADNLGQLSGPRADRLIGPRFACLPFDIAVQ